MSIRTYKKIFIILLGFIFTSNLIFHSNACSVSSLPIKKLPTIIFNNLLGKSLKINENTYKDIVFPTKGVCGFNVYFECLKAGTFTVKIDSNAETGIMQDYDYNNLPPWNGYYFLIESLIIEKGITSIGDNAFSGCTKLEPKSVFPKNFWGNRQIKTICNPRLANAMLNAHYLIYEDDYYFISEEGKKLDNMNSLELSYKKLRINHYFSKSKSEYIKKMNRGRATTKGKRSLKDFYDRDKNDVYDYVMEKYVDKLKDKLKES